MTTALLVFGVVFSYQAQAQTCSAVVDNDADCGNNGCATVTVAGGTSPYDYVWYDNLGNAFPTTLNSPFLTNQKCNLPAGDYFCVVIDAVGTQCTTATITIVNTAAQLGTFVSSNISCNGYCDGEINGFAFNGSGNYLFTWSDDPSLGNVLSSSGTLSNACAGTYFVELNDVGNSCVDTFPVLITEPAALDIVVDNVADVSCSGFGDGSINVTATGPGILSYEWQDEFGNGVAASEDLLNVNGGIYSLILSNNNSCSDTITDTILEPSTLVITLVDSSNVSCAGVTDGAIDIEIAGGNGNVAYTWSGPNSFIGNTQDLNNLECGLYDVIVTDPLGCNTSYSHNIPCPSPISVTLDSLEDVSCFGLSDGEIHISVSGGTPSIINGYNYSWNGNSFNTEDLTGIPLGSYSVEVTDSNMCLGTFGIIIAEPALLETNVLSVTDASCYNAQDGAIDVRVDGGTAPFTASVYDNGFNLLYDTVFSSLSVLHPVPGAGLYDIVVNDANGCQASLDTTVGQPSEIIVTLDSAIDVSCLGFADAEIYVSVIGGAGNYNYSWTGPSCSTCAAEDITNLSAGVYNLVVTDATNCIQSFIQNVSVPTALTMTVDSLVNVSCKDSADATIALTANGGTAPYSYFWNGPNGFTASDSIVASLDIGAYDISVTDTNGCVFSLNPQIISQPAEYLVASFVMDSVVCFAENTGAITTITTGGTTPYSYSWSHGDILASPSSLFAGEYYVTITDAQGCNYVDTIDVLEPNVLLVNLVQIDENCGQLDGQVIASPTGGTAPYTYSWNSNSTETSNVLSGLNGGTFIPEIVTITDANGCSLIDQITVQEALPITLGSSAITDISCYLGSDGQIEANIVGGLPPYTYQWYSDIGLTIPVPSANVLNDSIIFDMPAGSYYLSITDASGCSSLLPRFDIFETQSATLTVGLNTNQSFTSLACFNDQDGQISVNVSGGTPFPGPHYEYTLNGVQQSQLVGVFSGLSAGTYELVVNDNYNCEDDITITITEPDELETTLSQTPVNCFGGSDAVVTATVAGGISDYIFDWSQGTQETTSAASVISSLIANTYSLVVTDNNGCVDTASIVVTQPLNAIDLSVSYTNETCREEDGIAAVVAQGGTPTYLYNWTYDYNELVPIYTSLNIPNPSVVTADLTDVYNGWYFITVTDANGCVEKDSVLIGLDSSPEIVVSTPIHPLCYADMTGQVSVSAINGNPDYEFSYDGFDYDIIQVFSGLGHGQHFFTVRDSLGCIDTAFVDIIQPDAVLADNMLITHTSCNGDDDGSITAVISGGTIANDYTYQWYNPNGGPAYPANPTGILATITDLTAGVYTLNVEDDNGCEYSTTAEVNEPLAVNANAFVTSSYNNAAVTCFGSCDGSVQVSPAGGTAPYTYQWSSGSTTDTDQNLCAGIYSVEVTDINSCAFTTTVEVVEPSEVSAMIPAVNVTHVNCEGWSTGVATVNASGGIPTISGYTYFWADVNDLLSPLSFTETVNGLAVGAYQVEVTDLNGCIATATVIINDNNAFTLAGTNNTTDVSCFGFNDGFAHLNPINGILPYTHSWSDPLNQQTDTAYSLAPGWYTDTIYDAEGCEIIDSIFVGEPSELVITTTNVSEVSCYNAADGSIQVIAQGGVPTYTYSIDCNVYNNNNTFSGLNPGTYTMCVQDANGCIDDEVDVVIAPQPSQIVINNLVVNDISCFGFDDGSATVTASGGTGGLSYEWSNNQTNTSATGFTSGLQNILITDENGCDISESFIINEPSEILVDSFVVDNYCAQVNQAYITVYANGGTGVLTYLANGNIYPDYEINYLTVGLYDVTIEDDNGCTVDSVINVPDPNIVAFNTDTICLGDSLLMNGLANFTDFQTFMWVDTDILSTEASLTVSPEQTTNYFVSAWDNGCYSSLPFLDTIPVVVNTPIIDAGDDLGITRGESITLTVTGDPTYIWSTGEFTQDITVNPLITTYYTAYAVDPTNGCLGMDSVRVFVGMNEGFSPNADGYNDTWEITYLNQYSTAKVEIFNRWGSKLSEYSAPSIENWDGTYQGRDLPSGTYYYIISFDDSENRDPLSGPVTIVR